MTHKGAVISGWYLMINILSGTNRLELDGLVQFDLKIHPSNKPSGNFQNFEKGFIFIWDGGLH